MASAEEDLVALLAVPREERRARIERARSRFRGPQTAELLIEESRRRIPGDPGEAYDLAELARFIVHRSPGTPESFDLVALATASMANASRAGGDWTVNQVSDGSRGGLFFGGSSRSEPAGQASLAREARRSP